VDARQHLAGAGPGDLVAVAIEPGPLWMPLLEEAWASGAALLPIDPRLRQAEVRAVLDRARPGILLDREGATVRTDAVAVDAGTAVAVATSGTTGAPKVAELSRAAIEAAVGGSASILASRADDSWLCCLPVAHVGGLLVLLRGVITGAAVEVRRGFDAAEVAASDADHVSLVPTMLRRLLASGADLSRFRTILVGGGALAAGTADAAAARGAHVVTTYGLTETCGGIAYDGRLFDGAAARLGPEDELQLAGPTTMRGYLGDPAATASAFTLDGWLRTGDVGRIDDAGSLEVLGRLDERIRTGAETVWPSEVEAALRDHPKVADAAVAGRPDQEWGAHVVVFVVPSRIDDPPSLEELRAHASQRIARYKAPRELVLLPELPRTVSGKVRRSELR
jgi:o-succinylbenzoate---CoA ligase